MSQYFTRPCKSTGTTRGGWNDAYPLVPHLTVSDHEATDTGLINQHGDPILRAPRPIGFGRDGEW